MRLLPFCVLAAALTVAAPTVSQGQSSKKDDFAHGVAHTAVGYRLRKLIEAREHMTRAQVFDTEIQRLQKISEEGNKMRYSLTIQDIANGNTYDLDFKNAPYAADSTIKRISAKYREAHQRQKEMCLEILKEYQLEPQKLDDDIQGCWQSLGRDWWELNSFVSIGVSRTSSGLSLTAKNTTGDPIKGVLGRIFFYDQFERVLFIGELHYDETIPARGQIRVPLEIEKNYRDEAKKAIYEDDWTKMDIYWSPISMMRWDDTVIKAPIDTMPHVTRVQVLELH